MEKLNIVSTLDQLNDLAKYLADKDLVAFDTETDGVDKESRIIGFSVCSEIESAYYVILYKWDGEKLAALETTRGAKEILQMLVGKKLIMHNAVFDCAMVRNNYKIDLMPSVHTDTMILGHVLDENRENHWSIGLLARTAGVDAGVFTYPLMVNPSGLVYEHEVGYNYDGSTLFAESGPVQLGNGDNIMNVRQVVPDEQTLGEAVVSFKTRLYPTGTQSSFGPYTAANPTSVRFSGRQVNMVVTGAVLADWRVGVMRLEAVAGGKR